LPKISLVAKTAAKNKTFVNSLVAGKIYQSMEQNSQPKISLKAGQTIVFIGDSITDADRFELAYQPYGFGYVHFVAYTLLARYPQLSLNIINTGISGNTVRDLANRWQADCLRHKPDILSILIGVNDVWRQHQEPELLAQAVYLDEFETTYTQLLLQAKKKSNSQLVLIEPFMFCDDAENQMLKNLRSYICVVDEIAEEFDAVLVPLQSFIDEQIKKVPPKMWSDDFVHPYTWAHAWIGQRWFDVVGL